jgi:hypothetical protein
MPGVYRAHGGKKSTLFAKPRVNNAQVAPSINSLYPRSGRLRGGWLLHCSIGYLLVCMYLCDTKCKHSALVYSMS